MSSIKWTKRYDLFVKNEHFGVFVAEDDYGQFHAGCIWYEIRGGKRISSAPGQPNGYLQINYETKVDTSEKTALAHLLQWVTEKFGSDYRLAPEE